MSQINNIILNGQEHSLGGESGTGLTEDIKRALLDCFANVAWINTQGQTYYDALENALYPPANLTRITAVYTQSGVVYDTATLDDLKADLVVTAYYDDGTSEVVTNGYVLTGTIQEGTSIITCTYAGKTKTFDVVVTHYDTSLYNWDFANGIVDSKQGVTAVLGSGVTQSGNGLDFSDANGSWVSLVSMASYSATQFTVEIDVGSILLNTSNNNRLLNLTNSSSGDGDYGMCYRGGSWRFYDAQGACTLEGDTVSMDYFDGKTLKIQIDYTNKKRYIYADGELCMTFTAKHANSNGRDLVFLGVADASTTLRSGSNIKAVRIYEGLV